MTSTGQQVPSPQVLKQLEKELKVEGKQEESRLKHLAGSVTKAEKEHAKAQKAVHKAEDARAYAEKKELKATKAMNKAIHEHDIAVANLHNAEQKEQLKKQNDSKLLKELQDKKIRADAALQDQGIHNKEREAKLAELQSKREPVPELTAAVPEAGNPPAAAISGSP